MQWLNGTIKRLRKTVPLYLTFLAASSNFLSLHSERQHAIQMQTVQVSIKLCISKARLERSHITFIINNLGNAFAALPERADPRLKTKVFTGLPVEKYFAIFCTHLYFRANSSL